MATKTTKAPKTVKAGKKAKKLAPVPPITVPHNGEEIKLRKPQKKILLALLKSKNPLTAKLISDKSGVDDGWVGNAVGRIDPDVRREAEKRTGWISLITLGLVKILFIDVDGIRENVFTLTTRGIKYAEMVKEQKGK